MNTNKLINLLALGLALLAPACSGMSHTFKVQGFTTDEIVVLNEAAKEWCVASKGALCASFVQSDKDNTAVLVETLVDGDYVVYDQYVEKDGVATIKVLNQRTKSDWKNILRMGVRHELGHHFGCHQELTNGAGVMSEDIEYQTKDISEADLNCVGMGK